MAEFGAFEIQSNNWWLGLVGVILAVRLIAWKRNGWLAADTHRFVNAFACMLGGLIINRFWFAMSRATANIGETWNHHMFDWRWVVVEITTLLIIVGMWNFMQIIDDFSDTHKYWSIILTYAASRAISIAIGFA